MRAATFESNFLSNFPNRRPLVRGILDCAGALKRGAEMMDATGHAVEAVSARASGGVWVEGGCSPACRADAKRQTR